MPMWSWPRRRASVCARATARPRPRGEPLEHDPSICHRSRGRSGYRDTRLGAHAQWERAALTRGDGHPGEQGEKAVDRGATRRVARPALEEDLCPDRSRDRETGGEQLHRGRGDDHGQHRQGGDGCGPAKLHQQQITGVDLLVGLTDDPGGHPGREPVGEHQTDGGARFEQENLATGGWMAVIEDRQGAEQDDGDVERHRVGLAPHRLVRTDLEGECSDGRQGPHRDTPLSSDRVPDRCRLPKVAHRSTPAVDWCAEFWDWSEAPPQNKRSSVLSMPRSSS